MFLKESFHFAYNSNYRCDLLVWLSRPHLESKAWSVTPLTVQGRHSPGGMRQSPFCGATGATFSLAKCTFFFPSEKERNRNHPFLSLDSRWKPFHRMRWGPLRHRSAVHAPAPTLPVVRRPVGLVGSHRDALISSQSSSQGSTFRVDFMLSVFHDIPIL